MSKRKLLLGCICVGILTLIASCKKESNHLLSDVIPEKEMTLVFTEYQKEASVSYRMTDQAEIEALLEQIGQLSAKPAEDWSNESVTLPIYGIAVAQKGDDEAYEPQITYGYWSNGYWIMPDGQAYKVKLPVEKMKENYMWESENSFSSVTSLVKAGTLVSDTDGWKKELLTEARPAEAVPGLVTKAAKYGTTLTVTIDNQSEQAYTVEQYEYVLEVCLDEVWYEIPLAVWGRFERQDILVLPAGVKSTKRYSLSIYDSLPDGTYRLVAGSGENRESLVEFVLEQSEIPKPTEGPAAVRNLNGLEIIIGDTYSPEVTPAPTNAWEEATGKYREEIMGTHNCTIGAKKVADWEEMQEVYINSVLEGEPVAQVFELDYRFLAKPLSMGLFYDLATLEELGVSLNEREHKDKWSPAVNKLMTKGESIYGMRSEWMEPGGGIDCLRRRDLTRICRTTCRQEENGPGPSSRTETAADIAFAYDLYTNETPGYNDPVSYQEAYYSDFEDERACDETLPYYNDKRRDTVYFLNRYLVDGLDISDLTKNYPFTEKTPEACVDEVWDSWQALIDKSNVGGDTVVE